MEEDEKDKNAQNINTICLFNITTRKKAKKARQRAKKYVKDPEEVVMNDNKVLGDKIPMKDNNKVMEDDKHVKNVIKNVKDPKEVVIDDNKFMGNKFSMEDDNKVVEDDINVICLHHLATIKPVQAYSILWCPRVNKFIQKTSKNHKPLKLEVEMLHEVDMNIKGNSVRPAREPIMKENKRLTLDNTNCPETGALVTITGKNLMKKMGLNNDILLRDNTRISATEGTSIKVWGFIPIKLRVKDKEGEVREANECLYFAEGILTTLVSLGALKNLGCVSKNFPYPETESASSLTKRDEEKDEKEVMVKIRQPTPTGPEQILFPPTEENITKLKAWLVKKFLSSSFNTSSAPLARMLGPPMKIHINMNTNPVAILKPIPIPHHWQETIKAELDRDCKLVIIKKVPMGVPIRW